MANRFAIVLCLFIYYFFFNFLIWLKLLFSSIKCIKHFFLVCFLAFGLFLRVSAVAATLPEGKLFLNTRTLFFIVYLSSLPSSYALTNYHPFRTSARPRGARRNQSFRVNPSRKQNEKKNKRLSFSFLLFFVASNLFRPDASL